MANVIRGEAKRTMMFCIDSYEDQIPKGYIYGGIYETPQRFDCLLQMLLVIEQGLENANYPQAFMKMREFSPTKKIATLKEDDSDLKVGKLATFKVRILFRQNASWQGSISWLEGKSEEVFRSALELILLLNSALDSTAAEGSA